MIYYVILDINFNLGGFMSKMFNSDPDLFYNKANAIFFENFFNISAFIDSGYIGKRNINLFYTELYSSLHDYCELTLRGLVVEKDVNANISSETGNTIRSVNASILIDIVKSLHGNDFFEKNPINYNDFNLLFYDINSKRNADSHTSYLFNVENIKNDLNKILNDYIVCYFVLSKKKQFLIDYFLYFRKDMINNLTNLARSNYFVAAVSLMPLYTINKHLSINKLPTYFLYDDLKHFIILFNHSSYNDVIFRIPVVIDKVKCPNCVNFFGEHYHDYKTLIKLSRSSDSFSCYICRKFLKLKTINCVNCSIKGIRKSYARNNVCILCNPPIYKESTILKTMKEKNKEIKAKNTYFNELKKQNKKWHLKNINNNCDSLSSNKIGIYYCPKNMLKKINNIDIIYDLFNAYSDSLKDNPSFLELFFSTNKYKAAKRKVISNKMKAVYRKKLVNYILYYKLFYSFKNCVYIYLSKGGNSLNLKNFNIPFLSTISKSEILNYCLEDFNDLFDEIIDSIQDDNLKTYLEDNLYEPIRVAITNNIYAGYPDLKSDLLNNSFAINLVIDVI
jgi:hypothetical protein